ncbi:BlaI/MecI/CopY family transcriptional regulator [Wenzhouxiangella sp. XN79A]|uniref:BlaI/MecI/CopY family transcriptional regulator n=1 Tax=Wenzhouxiangella sp. XN79A TaxID=2724193 RepID=UPI00144A8382|nr:BlaI/MecI/CopY family transcriptional regulator [Wenzhouxiangella sp. XN79A]NKI34806.1 BlaI/MecI/CopY family transcriptional regulator [Wenzhouxiangella sp. XN79A]
MKSISEAESILMQVLWQRGEATAEELREAVAERTDWQPGTVKALLNRLLNKGAIRAEREGRRFRYRPVLEREDYVAEQSRSLIDRLFDGRVAPLVAHFSEQKALSKSDLDELRRLIRELDDGE